jgi:mono/diheme cytochrome c family protein
VNKVIAALLCVLALLVLLAAASLGWAAPADTPAGNVTFNSTCASCHGPDGAGTAAGRSLNVVDLRSPAVQGQSDAQLEQIVKNGINNMPAFGDNLSDQQIAAMVAHVRTLGNKASAPARR